MSVAETSARPASHVSERITVTGVVQGVGFRPFVHRLATELDLDGLVGNDSTQVFIEVTGNIDVVERFAERLQTDAPTMAFIESITRGALGFDELPSIEPGFRIVESKRTSGSPTLVSPDSAVCADCVRELFDDNDRRHRHPFITCTNCGPRFTIVTAVPYDRPNTTMGGFAMCSTCDAEYTDPTDRRYHAQPIACSNCGPQLSFRRGQEDVPHGDPIVHASSALRNGEVVAIKGLGGYHLACDARNDAAVAMLRRRKRRIDKPFAVMTANLDRARELATISSAEEAVLSSPAAPIVLARARTDSPLSKRVAPGNPLVGLLLPYTPVHHLLMAALDGPLVMTSANRSGEPIAHTSEQIDTQAVLFDAVLDHDRPIHVPCDDSVVRVHGDRLLPVRRARGYAPMPIPFAEGVPNVLAVGGELKNSLCVTSGRHAWVSQHIGDMENLETLRAFTAVADGFINFYDAEPSVVAADAHPGYLSSRWARRHHAGKVHEVQHHHAHIASVMAEHQLDPTKPVLGFAFDGTGYGTDHTIWGGEVLVATAIEFDRVAHLSPILLPGGDVAIENPCRVALAHLHAAGLPWNANLAPTKQFVPQELRLLRAQLEQNVACSTTTSMGRLFDAVTSLLDLRHHITYEAQAAIELEIEAERSVVRSGGYRFDLKGEEIVVSTVLRAILDDLAAHTPRPTIAWRFHDAVAEVVERLAGQICALRSIDTVVLSGGTFQNVLLTDRCIERLHRRGIDVRTHSLVPPNDGGLALGQAWVAAHAATMTKGS